MNLFKKLPIYNIKSIKTQTLGVLIITFILSFSLFVFTFIGTSMKNGLESTKDRMGADIIVIPVNSVMKYEGVLLKGEPNAFYLDEGLLEEVRSIEGVKEVSPQYYMATLSESCCSFPIQIIGIDFDSDFSIKAWVQSTLSKLEERQVLAGSNIVANRGEDIFFFDETFKVKDKLDTTGMGFDNCVFMSIDDAKGLRKVAESKGISFPSDSNEIVSNIMINTKDGYSIDDILNTINTNINNRGKAIKSDNVVKSISQQMAHSKDYLIILLAIVWILCIIILLVFFPSITKSRIGEFASLRVLGATKKDVMKILITELSLVSCLSSLVGVIFGIIISILFKTTIKLSIDVPFLAPELGSLIITGIVCLITCSVVGPISSLFTIRKLNNKELAIIYSEEN